jgi:hypothetical protein
MAAARAARRYLRSRCPPLADVPAMLDPNLQVTPVLVSGISNPIGIVFLRSVNDYLVLEKASGQDQAGHWRRASGRARARPGG